MTAASYFDDMLEEIKYPDKPTLEKPDRKNYATNKEYHLAVAEAEDAFEGAKRDYKRKTEEYTEKAVDINNRFWEWALKANGLSELPENVRNLVKMYAWDEGHSYGYSSVENVLENISDVVIAAFEAGKAAEKGSK